MHLNNAIFIYFNYQFHDTQTDTHSQIHDS